MSQRHRFPTPSPLDELYDEQEQEHELEDATAKISTSALAHLIQERIRPEMDTIRMDEAATGALSKSAMRELLLKDRHPVPERTEEVDKALILQILDVEQQEQHTAPTRPMQAKQLRGEDPQFSTEKLDPNMIDMMLLRQAHQQHATQAKKPTPTPSDRPKPELEVTIKEHLTPAPAQPQAQMSAPPLDDEPDVLSSAPALTEVAPPKRPERVESVNIIPADFTAPTPLQPPEGFPPRHITPAPIKAPARPTPSPPLAAARAPQPAQAPHPKRTILFIVLAAFLGGLSAAGLVFAFLY